MSSQPSLDELAERLGHRFADPDLLALALTHPSAAGGRGAAAVGYERLEFLGDRVLGLVIADLIFARFPDEREGDLARRHVALVRREAVAEVARRLNLGAWLRLSRGEAEAGGGSHATLLADSCEAVIAALYLDGGLTAARRFVETAWAPLIDGLVRPPRDAKTTLQEWAQARGLPLPIYETADSQGPDHAPCFTVAVRVAGLDPATGAGPSKRAAAQAAAAALLDRIEQEEAGS